MVGGIVIAVDDVIGVEIFDVGVVVVEVFLRLLLRDF